MNPDPHTAWEVVLTLGVLLSVAVNLVTLSRAGKSQKREVTFGETLVPKEICSNLHAAIEQRLERLEQNSNVGAERASESRAAIYRKIDERHNELRSDLEAVRRELSEQIGNMPAQVITILKNTGAIK